MINCFKIRRKSDGLYSTGGLRPTFNKKGKTWNSRSAVSNHLNLVKETSAKAAYIDCQVVELEMIPTEVNLTDCFSWTISDKTKRAKELQEIRHAKRKSELLELEMLRLKARLVELESK